MPAPYPPVPFQLETALLVTLREALRWESSVATFSAYGTDSIINSGTLYAPPTETTAFRAGDYQRRDRELAWLDTRNAAAVVEVSLEIADVWNASALRPRMEGPQIGHLDYSAQDTSAIGLQSKVIHVKNASLPVEALQTDRDLASRDLVVYETLYSAIQNLFVEPPISSSGLQLTPITAWSLANGTEARADIATALPLNRDLFRDPDMNLADRDNQMAGYVAQLCQVLKNPFAFAERLYVAVYGLDSREVETYTLIQQPFETGHVYSAGDEIYYQGTIYRVKSSVGTTSDIPWTSPWAWDVVTTPRQRIWTCEPALPGRNRFVYDTENLTLQWFREKTDFAHVPQLVAMAIPGIFSGQTIQTVAQIPQRKDGQFWRGKAAHVVPVGNTLTDLYSLPNTASFTASGFLIQESDASFSTPGQGLFALPFTAAPGNYRVSIQVEPNTTVEMPAGQDNEGVYGTLGGVTFPGFSKVSWNVGLPPTQWSVEFDYTNLSGSADGFRLVADLDGATVFDDTAPFYFNDPDGNPLPNGELTTSTAFPIFPSGGKQVFSLAWTGGSGQLHVRNLRFRSDAFTQGRYRIAGTFAGAVAYADVLGDNRVPGVISWDFTVPTSKPADLYLAWEREAQIPLRLLRLDVALYGTFGSTPNVQGFSAYRNDCLMRAGRSAEQAYLDVFNSGTDPVSFFSAGSVWDSDATERWMAMIEQAEPRLRQVENVPTDGIVPGRQYIVESGSAIYQGYGYATGKGFLGDVDTVYVWASAGTLDQVGAWQPSKATHLGRPCLAPAGVYFDYDAGTVAVAYGPERNLPEVVTLQAWMIENGFYSAQPEFWLPLNQ